MFYSAGGCSTGEFRPVCDVGDVSEVYGVVGDQCPSWVRTRSGSMKWAPIAAPCYRPAAYVQVKTPKLHDAQ